MGKFIDLSGQKFNSWTVLKRLPNVGREIVWECQCECGVIKSVYSTNLKSGRSKSCGCQQSLLISQSKKENLINQQFGNLLVIEESAIRKNNRPTWRCRCICGKLIDINSHHLKDGSASHCGCLGYNSIGEKNIISILQENNIEYECQYKFLDLGNYRYDFYLPNLNRLIEFDGKQHFEPNEYFGGEEEFLLRQKNDNIKNQYALSHQIPLVRIPYWERDNITLNMILGDQYLYNPSNR